MGKKGTKRKTRWRVLPIGEDGGSGSGNEEEGECENVGGASGTYARATQQQRSVRRPNRAGNPPGGGGYYNKQQQYHHHSRSYNHHDTSQPLVTTEKQIFNEEEYTKITTPRQDVLFKKGYLGRKRPTVTTESSEQTTADFANGNAHLDLSAVHNDEGLDNDPNEIVDEQPQFIYTNGFVDQSGVYYINGSGYEIYDPYSGQVTVLVGPHYGPNGGPPVLAAVPCQPVPLQPLEWFNPPGFLPYVTAPCHNGLARDRRKRYSTDSQNCSPQSSESTGPPGSPQESDEVALNGGAEGVMYHHPHHPPPPPYVYPGYMFGAPMYNMNGVTVQSTPNAAPSSDVGAKRRKKKRRRRRRRNGVEDGSEESSSEDKEPEEEPMSVTSQESSLESDSKLSNIGENPDRNPRSSVVAANLPVTLVHSPPPVETVVDIASITKSNVQTQTVIEKEDVVELNQQPNHISYIDKQEADKGTVDVDFKVKAPQEEVKAENCEENKRSLVNGYNCVDDKEVKDICNEVVSHPKLNGGFLNGKGHSHRDVVVNGDRLVNGHDIRPKGERKAEKKGKKSNGLTNCHDTAEKPHETVSKQVEANGDFVFQDDGFVYTHEFINGNVEVKLDEESEWITVKGHKGSQGKRSDSGRLSEEKKFSSELTNGHVKLARDYKRDDFNHKVNGVGGKDKVLFKNNSDKFKSDKSHHNGKIDEKCTYSKVKLSESLNKEKTQLNGKGKLMNSNKMDGNEKVDPVKGKETNNVAEAEKKISTEKSGIPPESSKDVPRKSIQEFEEATPTKPSRKERKNQKNGSPPKTPDVTLTATEKPFEMPSVSLRPETFVQQMETSPKPDHLSREDSLLSALTLTPEDSKAPQDSAKGSSSTTKREMVSKEGNKLTEVATKPSSNTEKRRKSQEDPKGKPEASKSSLLKDLMSKTIEEDHHVATVQQQVQGVQMFATSMPPLAAKSLKDTSKEFLEKESQNTEISKPIEVVENPVTSKDSGEQKMEEPGNRKTTGTKEVDSDSEATPPVPPPRLKKWRPANKRLSSERAPTPGKTSESTDESSSSSSQESEESVIECLSSGFNSPKVKVSSGFSSDDEEDIIFQGKIDEKDPKVLGRISESYEDVASQNGKHLMSSDGSKRVLPEANGISSKHVSKEEPKSPLPQVSVQTPNIKETFSDIYKSEEHLKNVQKMAQEIVDCLIDQAVKESVRLKYQKDNDPSKLGITDAVTRWLRSQSPDVLSLPRNEDSESDISDDFEDDAEDETTTGSKNLKSNPLPAPSVKYINNQLNIFDLVGNNDGMGRRVAKIISEKKDLKDARNDTPDLEDDAISNDSISCGEWDLWDCQHGVAQNYDEILTKPNKKHTKNTNEINIISQNTIAPHSPIHNSLNKSSSLVPECLNLSQPQLKYDPLANDTFSPIESTLLNEIMESTNLVYDRCNNMCDPTVSVAKYYILGPHPEKTRSLVEDLDCSDSDASSITENNDNRDTYGVSLAEELARLEQPLPASWAVEPIKIEKVEKMKRCSSCHCSGQEFGAPVDSGVESGDEIIITRKRESMSVFKRKLVGRLKGEGAPFPCGGICCILQ